MLVCEYFRHKHIYLPGKLCPPDFFIFAPPPSISATHFASPWVLVDALAPSNVTNKNVKTVGNIRHYSVTRKFADIFHSLCDQEVKVIAPRCLWLERFGL